MSVCSTTGPIFTSVQVLGTLPYSLNGERLGTFNGHNGSIWCIDVNWDSSRFISGSGDNSLRIWDCQTGKEIGQLDTNSSVRTCAFSFSANTAVFSTDKALGHQCEMFIIDTRTVEPTLSLDDAIIRIPINGPRISAIVWGALDESIITGHEDGEINIWDVRTGKKLNSQKGHKSQINDMQVNKDGTMFITASKDHTAKLFDSESLMHLKTYKTERPINSATISPIYDHVVLGGGQDAMDVTTTSTRQGKFDARFYHLVFEEEFARLKGHFGPINSLAFHPNGRSFSSGGEDGYIRINTFDQSYFDFHFEY
ncbi:eukaryotic translation initiation factor 3 subunit I-like isoform X4 [Cotesia glomerata]|uniref:eukaryotic translation initiation factor 3 subunit I-like isoform X4 n=1 Tax=Cotesia glomerata TaxID=32391 RepID=UPI001D02F6F6|nr:eukaryotic translation initiation factor 3 subunit I-like isoform X4 [Cotesia glomerata]XP_044587479.1 eukaryotic translation initiation factor 3 subunit I-like isoform X4 [Cotesia glomerata]